MTIPPPTADDMARDAETDYACCEFVPVCSLTVKYIRRAVTAETALKQYAPPPPGMKSCLIDQVGGFNRLPTLSEAFEYCDKMEKRALAAEARVRELKSRVLLLEKMLFPENFAVATYSSFEKAI